MNISLGTWIAFETFVLNARGTCQQRELKVMSHWQTVFKPVHQHVSSV